MIILLAGAHGTGKTEIAKRLRDGLGLTFFESRAADIHREFGVTGGQQVPFALRLEIQRRILEAWKQDYAAANLLNGVFDRTPVDFAAYLLADVARDMTEHSEAVMDYVSECMKVSADFDCLLLCNPHGGTVANRGDDKPDAANIAYMTHVQVLMRGLVVSHGIAHGVIPAGGIEQRMANISSFLSRKFDQEASATILRRMLSVGGGKNAAE